LFYRTEPNNWDTNGDGLPDGLSIQFGIDPLSDDPDGDTLTTAQELILGTNPLRWDTDRDEVPDHLDAFPLDPARWNAVAGDPSDTTAPQIFLTTPAEAVEI
jgi:hypothetical protein